VWIYLAHKIWMWQKRRMSNVVAVGADETENVFHFIPTFELNFISESVIKILYISDYVFALTQYETEKLKTLLKVSYVH
jgi:hypothetical protein